MSPAGEYIWRMHENYRAHFECYNGFVFVSGSNARLPSVEDATELQLHGVGIVEILCQPVGGMPITSRSVQ